MSMTGIAERVAVVEEQLRSNKADHEEMKSALKEIKTALDDLLGFKARVYWVAGIIAALASSPAWGGLIALMTGNGAALAKMFEAIK